MGNREIVATIYRSVGNESVGDMWTETKVFECDKPIEEIMKWVDERTGNNTEKTKIVITVRQF